MSHVSLSAKLFCSVEPMMDDRGCWEWFGGASADGYGRFTHKGRKLLAHRVSWEVHSGSIPRGMLVLHRCDNPPCVNPSHLFLGTHKDNAQDRERKGRRRPYFKRSERTECKNGHVYEPGSFRVVVSKTGPFAGFATRECRACRRAKDARQRAKRRAFVEFEGKAS